MEPAAFILAALLGLVLGLLLMPLAARLARRPLPRPVVLALPLAAALTAVGLWLRHGLTPSLVLAALYAVVLLTSAAVDLADRRIPNVLTYPAIVLAVLSAAFLGPGLLPALAGGALAGGLFLVGYLLGWNGLGDAKLALLVGLILGFPGLLPSLAVGLVVAGLVAGGLLIARQLSGEPGRYRWLPYGPYLALAGLLGLVGVF